MEDVARRAGVSKATVSSVVNGSGSVRDSTRERVLKAVEELKYRTGAGAKGRDSRQKVIGLLIKEFDNPYYGEIIVSARERALEKGYSLLVGSSEGDYQAERALVSLLDSRGVDGLIVTPVLDADTDLSHLFELKRRNFPFVLLEEIRGVRASLVDIDNVEAARRATQYLISEGHTRILHLAGPPYSTHSEQRVLGVRRAYSESRLIFREELVVTAGAHAEDGYRAGKEYFGGRGRGKWPTAVVCYNDLVALGLLRALAELGASVPEDVSLVGFDDLELLGYLPVPLTSVRIPKRQMGRLAAELLIRHIEAPGPMAAQREYLEADLVVRGSTRSLAGGRAEGAETE